VDIIRKVNGGSVPGKKLYGEKMEVHTLLEILLKDMHFYEESGGGVTFSGGEPLMQPEGLLQLLEACKKYGIHTTVDTCGYASPEQFERVLPLTDLLLFDLKHMDPALHKKHTGVDNGPILSNAAYLLEQGAPVIFRIPVIPGINTTEPEVSAMVRFLSQGAAKMKEVHLLPYHRIAGNKYRKLNMEQHLAGVDVPDEQMMFQLKETFKQTGLDVIIGG
jgi:pyruvate formate lyase activating enzyme